jgi:hypothetical protein
MGTLRGRASCLAEEPAGWHRFRGASIMANDGKRKGHRPAEPTRDRSKVQTERPFDKWLQKQLHAMYDEITSEPLPKDLLNLIERDAKKKPPRQ